MEKRMIALLLSLGMAVSLAACGGGEAADQNQAEGDGEETGSAYQNDEEPYTVAIQVVTLPGTVNEGEEDREAAINEITLPAINCKVDIQEVWISELSNTTSMAIAGGEKVDLIHVGTVQPLSAMVGSDMLLELNENDLLNTHGPKLVELFGDYLASGEAGGKLLAVPAKNFNASGAGFDYNKTVADKYNITIPEETDFQGLEDALYAFHETGDNMYPFYMGSGQLNFLSFFYGYDSFGQEGSYGVILDAAKEPKVENIYASDLFKEYCLATYKWRQDGVLPGDPVDSTTAQEYFGGERLFVGGGTSIDESNKSSIGAKYEFEVGWSQMVKPRITTAGVTEYMWGIAHNSERPDKAMDFLNYLYEDPRVANILKYGLEGVNYEFAEGSDKVIVSNGTYLEQFLVCGDQRQCLVQAPAGEDFVEKCQAMEAEAEISPILGYMFDDSGFQVESSVIYSTILEYLPRLQNGMGVSEEDTLAIIDEFNQKLDAAGINDVIAENQKQLDEFMASKSKTPL